MTAAEFIESLKVLQTDQQADKAIRSFKGNDGLTMPLGVKFGEVFKVAKAFIDMPLSEIEKLLESKYYEIRIGAVSIMDFQARAKKINEDKRKALFELYLRKHSRLNNWDFVDRAAPSVIGLYLLNKPRDILYTLARSENKWERRTSIVSTYTFIKIGQIEDTFQLAEILVDDPEEYVNTAVGSWIREAGKKDVVRLRQFLDKHAHHMPRITLRFAIEKLDKPTREIYLKQKP